jgi:hypothetical protein
MPCLAEGCLACWLVRLHVSKRKPWVWQVVGITHRYKSKYVTTVMIKPKHRRHRGSQDLGNHQAASQ